FKIECSLFHRRRLSQNRLTCGRHHKTVGRSVQQLHAKALLQERKSSPDRHMTDAKNTRRARKRTLARGSEKKPHVIPLPFARPVHLRTSYVNRRTLSRSISKRYFLPYEPRECEMERSWASYRFSGVTRIMNPQLSEALGLATVFGAIIRPLVVAIILFALWHALARTNLGSR